jgi:hypothetical protein
MSAASSLRVLARIDAKYVEALMLAASEQITLVGPFTHRKPARHAPADRFTAWRLRLRAAELAAMYGRAPLLQGLQRRAVGSGSGGFRS